MSKNEKQTISTCPSKMLQNGLPSAWKGLLKYVVYGISSVWKGVPTHVEYPLS